jgi:hypothetical protein
VDNKGMKIYEDCMLCGGSGGIVFFKNGTTDISNQPCPICSMRTKTDKAESGRKRALLALRYERQNAFMLYIRRRELQDKIRTARRKAKKKV